MKKHLLLLLLIAISATGCGNKNGYEIKGDFTVKGSTSDFVAYIKDNTWRNDIKGQEDYENFSVIYDGKNLYQYKPKANFAMKFNGMSDSKIAYYNLANSVINWQNGASRYAEIPPYYGSSQEVIGKSRKNNFDCKLIKLDYNREVCVENKYNFAIYYKYNDNIVNITEITQKNIPDEVAQIKNGTNIMDINLN